MECLLEAGCNGVSTVFPEMLLASVEQIMDDPLAAETVPSLLWDGIDWQPLISTCDSFLLAFSPVLLQKDTRIKGLNAAAMCLLPRYFHSMFLHFKTSADTSVAGKVQMTIYEGIVSEMDKLQDMCNTLYLEGPSAEGCEFCQVVVETGWLDIRAHIGTVL